MDIHQYLHQNNDRLISELFELIRIPSISTKSEHSADMARTASMLTELLLKAGADEARVMSTKGHPVVFAHKTVSANAPTVLIYGHYDVQPAEPLELWHSDPFEPTIREGKIFARGADDNKGQLFTHLKAFEYLVAHNELKCNIKFLIEGEEEIGSPNLKQFCIENRELLKANFILVSDTNMIGPDVPSITTGLRGLTYMEVEVTGPNRDLHSGIFGGAVANPIQVLCTMIDSLKDENNHITIPGFYDAVLSIPQEERDGLKRIPFSEEEYKKSLDVAELQGETGFTTFERTGCRPTLDVNGIWGGYTGEGAKTVLPSKAWAKISMRLVPNQKNDEIARFFEQHFVSIAPKTVKVKVKALHGGNGYVSDLDSPEYRAAEKAVEKVFGKKPVAARTGGSIPVIADFEEVLGIKTILMGYGLESNAIHSPNENFPVEVLHKGIETNIWFFRYFQGM